MTLLLLCWEFFKTGLFAVGGGLATIPFLYHMSDTYGWFSREMLANMIAISESTPGPIGVNMATYAGFHTAGVIGAVAATLSLVFPSVVVILIVAQLLDRFQKSRIVSHVFYGIRPAAAAMIAVATLEVFKVALFRQTEEAGLSALLQSVSLPAVILFVLLLICQRKWKLHPIVWILLSAAAGVIFSL